GFWWAYLSIVGWAMPTVSGFWWAYLSIVGWAMPTVSGFWWAMPTLRICMATPRKLSKIK
ncbi:hypothetical protein MEO94_15095, partial [Dolichospermum sp. ST_sed9]|nr:hypothetical protein [Dolichospermum sp. ST_sed9]